MCFSTTQKGLLSKRGQFSEIYLFHLPTATLTQDPPHPLCRWLDEVDSACHWPFIYTLCLWKYASLVPNRFCLRNVHLLPFYRQVMLHNDSLSLRNRWIQLWWTQFYLCISVIRCLCFHSIGFRVSSCQILYISWILFL